MIKLTKKRKPGDGSLRNSKRVLIETIPFYEIGTVEYMHISVDLTHQAMEDLVINLRNPQGAELLLHNKTKNFNGVYGHEALGPFIGSDLRG